MSRSRAYDEDIRRMYGEALPQRKFHEDIDNPARLLRGGFGHAYYPVPQEMLDSLVEDIFRHQEEGAWFDPSAFDTIYQEYEGSDRDPAGTAGDPVGTMVDLSRPSYAGNHAVASNNSERPILQEEDGKWYLDFSGDKALRIELEDLGGDGTIGRVTETGVQVYSTSMSGNVTFNIAPGSGDKLFGWVFIDRPLTAVETANLEKWLESKTPS